MTTMSNHPKIAYLANRQTAKTLTVWHENLQYDVIYDTLHKLGI